MKKKFIAIILILLIVIVGVIALIITKKSQIDINNYEEVNVIADKDGNIQDKNFDKSKILNVIYINQDKYPTGCESVSVVMALNYMGVNITVDEFIDYYLDMDSLEEIDNIYYGENPNNYFIGNPREKSGLGCYAPCIVNACNKFLTDETTAISLKNMDFGEFKKYIDNNIPVVVWITISLKEPVISRSWNLRDSGLRYTFLGNEHCVVLVGYDDIYYYFNDPLNGIVAYRKDIVELRYTQMGKNALIIK